MVKLWGAIVLGLSTGLVGCALNSQRPSATPLTSSSAEPAPVLPSPDETPKPALPSPSVSPSLTDPLPTATAEGNYLRTSHRHWVVVDPDPAGLNCRWSTELPEEWYSPATQYPRMNVSAWPVVHQFSTGTRLPANTTPAGFAIMYDKNQAPWLKVSLGDHDEICLVRTHESYVKPVE